MLHEASIMVLAGRYYEEKTHHELLSVNEDNSNFRQSHEKQSRTPPKGQNLTFLNESHSSKIEINSLQNDKPQNQAPFNEKLRDSQTIHELKKSDLRNHKTQKL